MCGLSDPYQNDLRHEQALRTYEVRKMEETLVIPWFFDASSGSGENSL
jgi:hypothetical protein